VLYKAFARKEELLAPGKFPVKNARELRAGRGVAFGAFCVGSVGLMTYFWLHLLRNDLFLFSCFELALIAWGVPWNVPARPSPAAGIPVGGFNGEGKGLEGGRTEAY
jgi:hypothetical protein